MVYATIILLHCHGLASCSNLNFYEPKCNLGKVNLESMRPAVFLTNMHAGWPQGLPCHVLMNQAYSPSALALLS